MKSDVPFNFKKGKRVVGIVQPTYLPWMPFFERMASCDVFIHLDDVKFSKNSFHNRNALKHAGGRGLLTVPVLYRGHSEAMINEILVDNRRHWNLTHWKSVQQWYSRAPFFEHYKERLEGLFMSSHERLIDVVMPWIQFLKEELRIETPCHLSSELNVQGSRNGKLVELCRKVEGDAFIVKPGTEDYHPPADFIPYGIEFVTLTYSPISYSQLYGKFEPHLSALDFILNCGPTDFKLLRESTAQAPHEIGRA
jgi:hypothetical protein